MKIKRYITGLLGTILALTMAGCETPDEKPIHSDVEISSAFIGDNMSSDNGLVQGTKQENKIIFYVTKSDQLDKQINIKKVLIKIETGIDASVSPKLIGRQNLSKPMNITVIAGDKTTKVYTLEAILEE